MSKDLVALDKALGGGWQGFQYDVSQPLPAVKVMDD